MRLKKAYDTKNNQVLAQLVSECQDITKRLDDLRLCHRDAWMLYNKPFGWEAVEKRYGALISRFSTTKDRIQAYLAGDIASIEELEAERLWYDCRTEKGELAFGRLGWGTFDPIYTAGV